MRQAVSAAGSYSVRPSESAASVVAVPPTAVQHGADSGGGAMVRSSIGRALLRMSASVAPAHSSLRRTQPSGQLLR